MSGEFIPDIWSEALIEQMKRKIDLETMLKVNTVVLTLGPNIGLTAEQVNDAIRDEATDPIIRDALIAFKAKMRITDTPPVRVRLGKIYGFKPTK